jgi:hypothetical protein
MKMARFEVLERSNAARRLVGRVALVGMLSTASVFLLQANAFASDSDLSSVVLANTVPGLVPLPLGPQNGPITQSNVDVVEGDDKGGTSPTSAPGITNRATGMLSLSRHSNSSTRPMRTPL